MVDSAEKRCFWLQLNPQFYFCHCQSLTKFAWGALFYLLLKVKFWISKKVQGKIQFLTDSQTWDYKIKKLTFAEWFPHKSFGLGSRKPMLEMNLFFTTPKQLWDWIIIHKPLISLVLKINILDWNFRALWISANFKFYRLKILKCFITFLYLQDYRTISPVKKFCKFVL